MKAKSNPDENLGAEGGIARDGRCEHCEWEMNVDSYACRIRRNMEDRLFDWSGAGLPGQPSATLDLRVDRVNAAREQREPAEPAAPPPRPLPRRTPPARDALS